MLWTDFVLFAIGAVIVIKGADYFLDGAIYLARATGISEALIGVTLVSMATTLPEFSVSSYAAYTGHSGMATGNAIGSVLCNTGLVLGGTTLFQGFYADKALFQREGLFMIGSCLVVVLMAIDGVISRLEGALLLLTFAVCMVFMIRTALIRNKTTRIGRKVRGVKTTRIVLFTIGGLMVGFGSRLLVASGVSITETLGVSEVFLGLTIVAVGTSLPELVTAIVALLKGHKSISVGNVIGANLLNLTWVLGGAAAIRKIPISATTILVDFPVMLLCLLLLLLFGRTHNRIDRWEGGILLAIYVVYLMYRGITMS